MQSYEILEKKFAEFNEVEPANVVACASGTAALHLGLECLQLPLGSQVVLSDYNMIACPRAITLTGLRPVFVDCDKRLLINFDMVDLENYQGKISAVMCTHIYGRRCDMEKIYEDTKYGAYQIEDLAEAHGIKPHPETDVACFSFYKNKIIAGEEGGAVYFRDKGRADLARSLRSLGFDSRHDFTHKPRGHNYRMSNCHAELVLKSLGRYDVNRQLRREIELCYSSFLSKIDGGYRNAPWVYDLRVPGLSRVKQDEIVYGLQAIGVNARHGFKPCTFQEEYHCGISQITDSPESYAAGREVFYLPINSDDYDNCVKNISKSYDFIMSILNKP